MGKLYDVRLGPCKVCTFSNCRDEKGAQKSLWQDLVVFMSNQYWVEIKIAAEIGLSLSMSSEWGWDWGWDNV